MPHPISDKVEGRGEGPAGGGEVQVQDGRADHEVGDGGDAGEGGHSPVDAAAWTEERERLGQYCTNSNRSWSNLGMSKTLPPRSRFGSPPMSFPSSAMRCSTSIAAATST